MPATPPLLAPAAFGLGLQGWFILIMSCALAVGLPLAVLIWWRTLPTPSAPASGSTDPSASTWATTLRWLRMAGLYVAVVGCQGIAIAAVLIMVNDTYGFYASWRSLLGSASPVIEIRANAAASGRDGDLTVDSLRGVNNQFEDLLVWTPPGYTRLRDARQTLPVVVVMSDNSSTPNDTLNTLKFEATATAEINGSRVLPFVALFPMLGSTGTEPQSCRAPLTAAEVQRWLTKTFPHRIHHDHFAISKTGWAIVGVGSGAECAQVAMAAPSSPYTRAAYLGAPSGVTAPLSPRSTAGQDVVLPTADPATLAKALAWLTNDTGQPAGGKP